MSTIYPALAPLTDASVAQLTAFLSSPTSVQRKVDELSVNTFLGDVLFTGRYETNGALIYSIGGGAYTNRDPEAVNPGAEYPRAAPTTGTPATARTTKWGQDTPITDENLQVQRLSAVNRGLAQVVNSVRRTVDRACLTAAAAAITRTQPAAVAWDQPGANPWRDIMKAVAQISDDDTDGAAAYDPQTVVVTHALFADLADKLISQLPRESRDNAVLTGTVAVVAGLRILPAPAGRMPAGIEALVLDTDLFGGLGYQRIPSPEYSGDPAMGIETWVRRDPDANDSWLARGRRPVVPIVEEPRAAVKITGA